MSCYICDNIKIDGDVDLISCSFTCAECGNDIIVTFNKARRTKDIIDDNGMVNHVIVDNVYICEHCGFKIDSFGVICNNYKEAIGEL